MSRTLVVTALRTERLALLGNVAGAAVARTGMGPDRAARWAARTCRSVHGEARHSGPHVGLRELISGAGDTVAAGPVSSRLVPSGIWVSSG